MVNQILFKLSILAFVLCCLKCTHAYSSYQNKIPNGDKIYDPCHQDGSIWSGVGHQLESGGGALNPFGIDIRQQKNKDGMPWTKHLCETDSDGDGLTNGEELGDPQCKWTGKSNEVLLNTSISHPGICEPIDSEKCKKKNNWFSCHTDEFKCEATKAPDIKTLNLTMPETPVQQSGTKYMCTYFDIPLDDTYQIIAWKAHIVNKRVLHHFIWFGCDETANQPQANGPHQCRADIGPKNCRQLTGWVVGLTGDCYPEQFGVKFGRHGYKRFMLQIHWKNNDNTPDYTDSSGLIVYYNQRLRQYDSALLTTGDVTISLKPGKKEVRSIGSCYPVCTQKWLTGPVYIYSIFSHMHDLGTRQMVHLYRNGTLIKILNDIQEFHKEKIRIIVLDTPVEFLPGDEIRTTCIFDTTQRNTTTHFGWGGDEEMCSNSLVIYPAENWVSKMFCYSWYKVPNCVYDGSFKAMRRTSKMITMGMKTIMRLGSKAG